MRFRNMTNFYLLIILCFYLGSFKGSSQLTKAYKKLSKAEKCWVLMHPFKAKKAYRISQDVNHVVDSILKTKTMGNHLVGNQLDAFKHVFWMWSLADGIGRRSASSLGEKHEKGNYQFYVKHRLEDGVLPDSISCKMDLNNNSVGLLLHVKNKTKRLSKQQKIEAVKNTVLQGKAFMVYQTVSGAFLDLNGQLIPKENYSGFWNNSKCLVPSSSQFLIADNKSKSLNLLSK